MTIEWLQQNKYQLVNFDYLSAYKICVYLSRLSMNELRNNQAVVRDDRLYESLRYFDDFVFKYLAHRFGEVYIMAKVEVLTEEFDKFLSLLIESQNDN